MVKRDNQGDEIASPRFMRMGNNLMDCMGLLERAYKTESLPVGIMDDIDVFRSRMLDMDRSKPDWTIPDDAWKRKRKR